MEEPGTLRGTRQSVNEVKKMLTVIGNATHIKHKSTCIRRGIKPVTERHSDRTADQEHNFGETVKFLW
jgi:hypothetical protein